MKRVLALLLVIAFVATIAAPAFAATTVKKPVKKVVKKAPAKKVVKKAAPKVVVPPPPPVVVPPPPPPPVKAAPVSTGLFGWGLETAAEVGMIAGMVGATGNIIMPDFVGLGPMIGLSDKAINYKLGLGYAQGKDGNSADWKAVPVILDGVINLPADLMGGVETFIGGGLNYVATRSGSKAGTIGGEIYLGAQGDLGLGGKTYGELGYSILRTGSTAPTHSSKSVTVLVGQKIML